MELDRRQTALARSFGNDTEWVNTEQRIRNAKAHAKDIEARLARARAAGGTRKEVRLSELTMMSLSPLLRTIHNWWLQRAERHYLICADVEQERAREAQMNVAYYQKRAAMARSARS
jgi:heme exporter protein D